MNFQKMCRICTGEKSEMKSIFQSCNFSAHECEIFEVITDCASVQIQKFDGFSELICPGCLHHLSQAYSFKKLCEDSDYKFRNDLIVNEKFEIKEEISIEDTVIIYGGIENYITESMDEIDKIIKVNGEQCNDAIWRTDVKEEDASRPSSVASTKNTIECDMCENSFEKENCFDNCADLFQNDNKENESNSSLPLENPVCDLEDEKDSNQNKQKSPDSNLLDSSLYITESSDPNKDLCPFCFESVGHFSRHLLRKHCDEEVVKKIQKIPLKSNDRRDAIMDLRKKGNFILNQQKNQIKPVRKPSTKLATKLKTDDDKNTLYFPCIDCLGYYKRTYWWKHNKICKAKRVNKTRLKADVISVKHPDVISLVAETKRKDDIIESHSEKKMVTRENEVDDLSRCRNESIENNNRMDNPRVSVSDKALEPETTKLKSNRIRWTPKAKKIVLDYFRKHVKTRTAPKKKECLTLIRQHTDVFKEGDWVRVKTLVFNTYHKKM